MAAARARKKQAANAESKPEPEQPILLLMPPDATAPPQTLPEALFTAAPNSDVKLDANTLPPPLLYALDSQCWAAYVASKACDATTSSAAASSAAASASSAASTTSAAAVESESKAAAPVIKLYQNPKVR
jgi:hypothetical protein